MGRYEGCMENPWDDISIQYVLVCTHVAKKRYVEAFKEESQLVSSVIWFFASLKALITTHILFWQVIPTFLYRKPRLDVTCLVLYIERPERPSFRRRLSKFFFYTKLRFG